MWDSPLLPQRTHDWGSIAAIKKADDLGMVFEIGANAGYINAYINPFHHFPPI
jgi:hypothetical protein